MAVDDTLKVTYRNDSFEFSVHEDTTFQELAAQCSDRIGARLEHISLLFMPKPGLLKHPFSQDRLLDTVKSTTRIKLIGTPTNEVQQLEESGHQVQAREAARRDARSKFSTQPTRNRDWRKISDEAKFTFHAIEPLTYLPNPEKSRRFLQRLAEDPGIKAAMRKHQFSVGLLTEMNPAEHTTHESRTLGLNRNKGEVIELRLRTDRYDGYRDYKVIRKTLCHELSHNVHSEHDRNFWDLTKQIEQEVDQNDWHHGGRKVSDEEFYNPDDTDDGHIDHGGWTGGHFVLGRSSDAASESGLSRREIIARAALLRQEKQKQIEEQREKEGS